MRVLSSRRASLRAVATRLVFQRYLITAASMSAPNAHRRPRRYAVLRHAASVRDAPAAMLSIADTEVGDGESWRGGGVRRSAHDAVVRQYGGDEMREGGA